MCKRWISNIGQGISNDEGHFVIRYLPLFQILSQFRQANHYKICLYLYRSVDFAGSFQFAFHRTANNWDSHAKPHCPLHRVCPSGRNPLQAILGILDIHCPDSFWISAFRDGMRRPEFYRRWRGCSTISAEASSTEACSVYLAADLDCIVDDAFVTTLAEQGVMNSASGITACITAFGTNRRCWVPLSIWKSLNSEYWSLKIQCR